MTQQFPPELLELPPMEYPRIKVMVTEHPNRSTERLRWIVGETHPLLGDSKIVAIYANEDFVEVYSLTAGFKSGIRDIIQIDHVRLLQEVMPAGIWRDELERAELGSPDDGPDDPGDSPDPSETQAAQTTQQPS